MKKSAFISDVLFTFSLVGIFTLCLFRYLKLSLSVALFLSVLCGALSASAIAALLFFKRKSVLSKRSDEAQKQKLLLHLALASDEQKTELFATALQAARQSKLRLKTDEAFYFLKFSFSPVTADEVAAISRWKTSLPKVLLCSEAEEAATRLCARLGIGLKTGDESYALVKRANALPQSYLGEELPENKKRKRLRICFARSNAKRFFTSGTMILLLSLITPFSYYYLVFGGILLLVAAVVRIFGYT